MSGQFSWELFNRMPVVGIMRGFPRHQVEAVAKVFYQTGLTNLEVTMNSPNAAEVISSLTSQYHQKLNVGAGTVCNMADLEKALKAGAQFIVTPILNAEVIKSCVAHKVPIFPGALTPTEIYTAWSLGASMVKVFPVNAMPAGYVREILAPLNAIDLIPTGGINFENFTNYFDQGAKGVGIGSHLFPKHIIEYEDWQMLAEVYKLFTAKYAVYCKGKA